jgi:hypothetical protein
MGFANIHNTKKMGQYTISVFWELNKRIFLKPYPVPKISTTLQELEGFTYATALDLNMGYYTIRLDPKSSEMCTIIFPWGKYSYQRLPIGFGGLADIPSLNDGPDADGIPRLCTSVHR